MAIAIEGLREAVRNMEKLGAEVEDLKEVMSSIAKEGAQVAAKYAPHKTGALQASIRGNRAKGRAIVTAGKARVKYAGPINYGWPKRNIRASNFIKRTDDYMEKVAPQMFEEGISKIIDKLDLG